MRTCTRVVVVATVWLGFVIDSGWAPEASAHGGIFVPPTQPPTHQPPPPGPGPSTNYGGKHAGSGPFTPGDTGATRGAPGPATGGPSTARPASATPAGLAAGPLRGSVGTGQAGILADSTTWEVWWWFNKDPYLDLKAYVHATGPASTGSDFFLGDGEVRAQGAGGLWPDAALLRAQVVPALRRALKSERSQDILTGTMLALGNIGDEAAGTRLADDLTKFLTDGNQEISETAAIALGVLGDADTVPRLLHVLTDTSRGRELCGRTNSLPLRTRSFAAFGLGSLSREAPSAVRGEVVRMLAQVALAEDYAVQDLPVACLTAMGIVPLPWAEDYRPPEHGVESPARCLQSQIAWLVDLVADDGLQYLVRAHAAVALGRLLRSVPDGSDVRGRALAALADPLGPRSKAPRELQQSCALALGMVVDSDDDAIDARSREALMGVREHVRDAQARNFALIGLARSGGRPGSGEGSDAGSTKVRRHLMKRLTGSHGAERRWAALALGVQQHALVQEGAIPDDDVARALRSMLDDARSPLDTGAYAIACGLVGSPVAVDVLLEKLAKNGDPATLAHVATGLGLLGEHGARDPLRAILNGARYKPVLLHDAAIALARTRDRDLVPRLLRMLGKSDSQSAQAALLDALSFVGDTRAVADLIQVLEDDQRTDLGRSHGAKALGRIADRRELPWRTLFAVDANYAAATTTLTDGGRSGVLDIL